MAVTSHHMQLGRVGGVTTKDVGVEFPATATSSVVTADRASSSHVAESPGHSRSHQWPPLAASGCAYLFLSMFIWSNVWTSHPTSTMTCGCSDASTFTWYIEWPAYAISHGLSPFFSTAMHYPSGVNLLANTSILAIGVPLAPITWLFGPVATLNVALTLAPVLSALAMFVLLRRWVSWAPAAFVGGLFYGFSPFVLVELTDAHLMLGMALVPPLLVLCLDELLIRQQHRPLVVGVALGLLITLQFFIGTEVLLITAIMAVVGIVLVVLYTSWRHPDVLRRRARFALVGLAAGALTAGVLLAYPAWFALAGPAHFSGLVWPGPEFATLRNLSTDLRNYAIAFPAERVNRASTVNHLAHAVYEGGYQGPILSNQYFGIGVLVVLIGGLTAWRRDRRLWLFGAISIVSVLLSLGVVKGVFLPWQLLAHSPVFENIVPYRFVLITYLAVAIMLGIIVDHTYQAVGRQRESIRHDSQDQPAPPVRSRLPRWSSAAAGIIVAAVALVPPVTYLAQTVPVTTQPVAVPIWFKTVAPNLKGHQVLYAVTSFREWAHNPLLWQAVNHMHYSGANAGGPGGQLVRAGKERPGATVIANVTSTGSLGGVTTKDIQAVRSALKDWEVTMVVMPDQPSLPTYDQIPSIISAAALFTAAIGERPIHQVHAWVWSGVNHTSPLTLRHSRIFLCTRNRAHRGAAAVNATTACVLRMTAPQP